MRKALLLILALALAVTTVMALAEGTPEPGEPTPPAVTEEATPETSETPEAPEETETTEEPEETEPVETENTEPTETETAEPSEKPEETATTEPTADATEEPTEAPTEEPTADATEEPTAEPTEEPALSMPTIDPAAALPMWDASPMAEDPIAANAYRITIPAELVMDPHNEKGLEFNVTFEMGSGIQRIVLQITGENDVVQSGTRYGWFENKGGDPIRYEISGRSSEGTRRKDNTSQDSYGDYHYYNGTWADPFLIHLTNPADYRKAGTYFDTLTFSVFQVWDVTYDPGIPEGPGIESVGEDTSAFEGGVQE